MSNDETNCHKIEVIAERIKAERELRLAFEKLMDERNAANKEAIKAAFASAEKASEKTEQALKEYKVGANEWRDTVRDAIAAGGGKSSITIVLWAIAASVGIGLLFFFIKK